LFRHFATGNDGLKKDPPVILHEWHEARVTFDIHNEHPLPWVLPLIGMFNGVEQTSLRQVEDNILKRDATFLS
jgi:hypothetical protein